MVHIIHKDSNYSIVLNETFDLEISNKGYGKNSLFAFLLNDYAKLNHFLFSFVVPDMLYVEGWNQKKFYLF